MKTTESGKPTYYGCTGSVVVNRKSDNTPVLLTSPACVGIKTSMAYQPATMIHEGGKIGNVVFRKNNEYVACALVEMRFRDGATHLESWFGRISSFRTSLRDGDLVKKSVRARTTLQSRKKKKKHLSPCKSSRLLTLMHSLLFDLSISSFLFLFLSKSHHNVKKTLLTSSHRSHYSHSHILYFSFFFFLLLLCRVLVPG